MRRMAPFAYCDACLARRLETSLSEMVAILAALAGDGKCQPRRRACYGCDRTLEVATLVESRPPS